MFEVLASDVAFRLDQTFRKEPSLAEGRKLISDWLRVLQQRFGPGSLRYLAASEHGSKRERLHFHIIMCFSGPKGSAATVRGIRAEGRNLFGNNTARLLKRPGDKQRSSDRSAKVAYAIKQTVGYALKGSKDRITAVRPVLRDENGQIRKDKNGKPMKERAKPQKRFTRSQGWGGKALQAMIDRTPIWRDTIETLKEAGFPPVFLHLRTADGSRYWLPAKANPMAPEKASGATYCDTFAPDVDQEETPFASQPVRDGYAQGERFSFDPAAAYGAKMAHKFADRSAPVPARPSLSDEKQTDWLARLLAPRPSEDETSDETSEEWDGDLGPAPHIPEKPKTPSRVPPLSYARRDDQLGRSAAIRRKRFGQPMPEVIRSTPADAHKPIASIRKEINPNGNPGPMSLAGWRPGDPIPNGYAVAPGEYPPRLYRRMIPKAPHFPKTK